ncbi:MAG: glycosyltransferase family 39 protein [Taibaiella sp.]|nr:glycosyltransferase family 39 protein [Taibaiella sp.]
MLQRRDNKTEKWTHLLVFALLITGAVLRMYIYLQNRNLIIDEANIARNIYERGFIDLLLPLDYEQYAPPLFLWVTKLFSLLFGMGELALRLYPFLCSLGALWLFYKILKNLVPVQAMWYPISLLVFSGIFLRYSSELKQYMPDVFITLLLIWLALRINFEVYSRTRFVIYWIVIGSVAIWASMPSVFVLAGVGCYYGWQAVAARQYRKLLPLLAISALWVVQFALYYFLILEDQANSDYLQKWHQNNFLFATPSNKDEWNHNWWVFSALMRQFEGWNAYVHDINTAFLITGTIMLARRAGARFFLLAVPVLAVCAAAALNQFSLMVRVSLFIIPVLMIVIGYGFAQYYYLRSVWLKVIILAAGLYAAGCNIAQTIEWRYKYEEITEGMAYLQEKGLPGEAVSIYQGSVPAFIYYTTMHPGKEKWASLKNADLIHWTTNYDSLGWQMRHVWSSRRPLGIIYTSATDAEFTERHQRIRNHMQMTDSFYTPTVKAFIFIKPE